MATEESEPTVKITLRTIYDEVIATKELVAPLPGKVTDHEARLRLLEAFKSKREGASAFANGAAYISGGAVCGFILNHVIK